MSGKQLHMKSPFFRGSQILFLVTSAYEATEASHEKSLLNLNPL